jgi:hypothetical protein
VAQQLLNVPQISPGIQHVRGERVAKAVGRYLVHVGALLYVLIDHAADAAGRDPCSLIIQETGLIVADRNGCVVKKDGPRFGNVMQQCLQGVFMKGHYTFLPAFAENADHPLPQVDVRQVDVHELAHANARGVEEFQDRAVSAAEFGVGVGGFDETHGVLHREVVRQLPLDLRRRDHLGRVRLGPSLANEELEQRP